MDYLADHEQTSLLVRNAAYIASVPLYDCGALRQAQDAVRGKGVVSSSNAAPAAHAGRFPYLYYWNASGLTDIFGRPLPVHFGIDVTSVTATKEEMLAAHASQRDWPKYHNGWDVYIEQMKEWTRRQGEIIGRDYGECFIQHRSTGHPHDNILAEIPGEVCVDLRS